MQFKFSIRMFVGGAIHRGLGRLVREKYNYAAIGKPLKGKTGQFLEVEQFHAEYLLPSRRKKMNTKKKTYASDNQKYEHLHPSMEVEL